MVTDIEDIDSDNKDIIMNPIIHLEDSNDEEDRHGD